jgi:hypothetical protein
LLAKRIARDCDRQSNKPSRELVPTSPEDVECLLEEALEDAKSLFLLAEMVEGIEQAKADEAAGIRRRPKVTMHVKSAAKLLPAAPKLDPAAPKPAERTGRRRSEPALALPGTPEADGVWKRGQVFSFHPRTWEGSLRASDGIEYPLAAGALMRSGLVTLVPGMLCEFKVVAGEAEQIKAAWH